MKPPRKTKRDLMAELETLRAKLAGTEARLERLRSERKPAGPSSHGDRVDALEANEALQKEIVHRKLVEEALEDTEKRFRAIFERAAVGVALLDLGGAPITANPALINLFGGNVDDLPPSLCNPLALGENGHKDDEPPAHPEPWPSQDHHQVEKRYILKDGRLMWCQMTVSLIRNAGGTPHSAVVMLVDITRRRETEKALRQSEARYRAIVEDQVELVSRLRPDYTYSFVNEAYCRRFELSRDELIGSSLWNHVPSKGKRRLLDHYGSLSPENPVATIEHRLVTPTGETLWQQWTDRGIFDGAGRLKEIQSVGRDITREKIAEKALTESEKQLRHLSSQLLEIQEKERKRIAHELHDSVGQYLSAIKYGMENLLQMTQTGNADLVSRTLETLVPLIRNTIEEVRRIYMDLRPSLLDDLGIVPTISWFCREFESIYTGIAIEKCLEIVEEEIPESLKIILFRILQETLNNIARHSYADRVVISLKRMNDWGIEFTVEDNGVGFDQKEALARNKVTGGLGLASMKERTELFRGTFSVRSSHGEGATIRASWADIRHLQGNGDGT